MQQPELAPGIQALVIGDPVEENNGKVVTCVKHYPAWTYSRQHNDIVVRNVEPVWEIDTALVNTHAHTGAPLLCPIRQPRYLIPLRPPKEQAAKTAQADRPESITLGATT